MTKTADRSKRFGRLFSGERLPEYPGEKGIQQMRALMHKIIADDRGQKAEVLPCPF